METELIINRLMEYKNTKKITEIAIMLGTNHQNLKNWMAKNTMDAILLSAKFPELSMDYLVRGGGPKYLAAKTAPELQEQYAITQQDMANAAASEVSEHHADYGKPDRRGQELLTLQVKYDLLREQYEALQTRYEATLRENGRLSASR